MADMKSIFFKNQPLPPTPAGCEYQAYIGMGNYRCMNAADFQALMAHRKMDEVQHLAAFMGFMLLCAGTMTLLAFIFFPLRSIYNYAHHAGENRYRNK